MIPEKRRQKIINKLKERNIETLDKLTEELGVSRVTIQRDVNLLEKEGLLSRVHGGVKINSEGFNHFESRFQNRLSQNYVKKLEIAKKGLGFVYDESTIFLDSSTTVYIFFKELAKQKFIDLNIITTSPAILCEALKYPDLKVISTGGELRAGFNMLCGSWVLEFLDKVNIDASFISAAGISGEHMLTTSNKELANILAKIFKRSRNMNLLADSSKFYKTGMLNISSIGECGRVVTDGQIDRSIATKLKDLYNLEIVF
ncbi:MAG: DeoR/GlpR family DNA-binding transcription regulator [Candidatus Humimicrobiaceae bacterium]